MCPPHGVLLVDGDAELLSVMAGQLRQEGIPLRMAATGREAVRLALQQSPALLVLEIELPDGNGFEVVGALRRQPGLDAVPLLVYTGLELSAQQCQRLSLGPTRYLNKSVTTDTQFKEAVVFLLRKTGGAARSSTRSPTPQRRP
ncbi:MAG TPA: response regulator [Thermoanaerobaculia bacterium]|nr:response regulator [Thermoanaerobaculia bacterium]